LSGIGIAKMAFSSIDWTIDNTNGVQRENFYSFWNKRKRRNSFNSLKRLISVRKKREHTMESFEIRRKPFQGWTWMVLNGSEWFWMVLNGSEWFWMVLNGSEWFWMVLKGSEGLWMVLNGSEGFWMVLNGSEWFWMVLHCNIVT
jgi:hypothetical protein